MAMFFWIGTALGVVAGMLHASLVFRRRLAEGSGGIAEAVYFAAWTIALWIMFGAYVMAFWIVGLIGMALSRIGRRARVAP